MTRTAAWIACSGLCLAALAMARPSHAQESLATKRLREVWDGEGKEYQSNEFYTTFEYSRLEGLGPEEGVSRRDPSSVIKVGDTYYVWYTRTRKRTEAIDYDEEPQLLWSATWFPASICYATSRDGRTWEEQGEAVSTGPEDAFDGINVLTPNVLASGGKYYLYYQASGQPYRRQGMNVIGMSWAESPAGPWHRHPEPVLAPEQTTWGPKGIHDPSVLLLNGKCLLYYKGEIHAPEYRSRAWGVAIADRPEGPFTDSPLNPVTNSGHEVLVWRHGEGVAALVTTDGYEKNTVQYAADGLNFELKAHVAIPPNAAGAFSPDDSTNTGDARGIAWGICHVTQVKSRPWPLLLRFDCDLTREGTGRWRFKRANHRFSEEAYLTDGPPLER
ncbi:MAG: family 43 glycosylhydrolase [Armatimonadota bacterium]